MYDLDGNSEVSQAEVMTKAGLTQAQVLGVFKVYDINGDGRVDMSELRNLFSKFDINGDGSVSQTEYNQHAKDVQSTGK
ncbi:hypothetical protein SNE40_021376 [Patella caerulea]|uniref:EF-hand domain-containing protein n=1 Tax=Patella caerulea TaxID=87958 RepID=A0AAN8G490_PATCE